MKHYDSIKKTIENLKKRGFTYDFNLDEKNICKSEQSGKNKLEDFKVTEVYRFEGKSNPSENSVVYAIMSNKHPLKGYLVNAYGIYAGSLSPEFISKIEIEHNEIV